MLLIYLEKPGPRVHYVMDQLFASIFRINYRICSQKEEFLAFDGAKFSYARQPLEEELHFPAAGLLEKKAFFQTEMFIIKEPQLIRTKFSRLPGQQFDPFSSIFFLLSRYEEWNSESFDRHGRFLPEASCLEKAGLLSLPLVNYWADQIVNQLMLRFSFLQPARPSFRSTITIDIDQAYAYRHKGLLRQMKIALSAITGKLPAGMKSPFSVWSGRSGDPYDQFDYLEQCREHSGLDFLYFFLCSPRTAYDKNIHPHHTAFARLVKDISRSAPVGIHPSYYTLQDPQKFFRELKHLQNLSTSPIRQSRQHYLRFRLPDTYRNLLQAGIGEDYSMGYAAKPGFRAGTCNPFFWFDLEKNETTSLRIFPVSFMDGSFAEYQQLSPSAGWQKMKEIIDTIIQWRGHFIPIWHNHSVSDQGHWKGWRKNFELMLDYVKKYTNEP